METSTKVRPVSDRTRTRAVEVEPTPVELAAIADEWPVIEAELAVVTAECRLAAWPDALAVRAHRRAVAALDVVARRAAPSATRVVVRRVAVAGSRPLTGAAPAPVAA